MSIRYADAMAHASTVGGVVPAEIVVIACLACLETGSKIKAGHPQHLGLQLPKHHGASATSAASFSAHPQQQLLPNLLSQLLHYLLHLLSDLLLLLCHLFLPKDYPPVRTTNVANA